MAFNPLTVISLPFVSYGGASYLAFKIRGRYLPSPFLSARVIHGLGTVIVLFGVLRNIPVGPLRVLAPGGW